jgi:hypothetical protein
MKLEYLIIMQKSGLPLYSRCFGGFCWKLMTDEVLLSGFLTALSSMPAMFGKEDMELKSVEMGNTKINFNFTTPSSHIICFGIDISTLDEPNIEGEMQALVKNLSNFLEIDHSETKWDFLTPENRIEFENQIKSEVIEPSLVSFQDNDFCRAVGRDSCPVDTDSIMEDKKNHSFPIWEGLKKAVSKDHMPRLHRIYYKIANPFLKIYLRIMIRRDMKQYQSMKQRKDQELLA